jgi:carboxypeptidase family protein/TonB-dependent receptor-like protein
MSTRRMTEDLLGLFAVLAIPFQITPIVKIRSRRAALAERSRSCRWVLRIESSHFASRGIRLTLQLMVDGLCLALISGALLVPSEAQVVGATLSGTITDSTGAMIPKAKASITNTATGVSRDAITDADGFYSVPNLLPGNYSVTALAPGFSTKVETGITLEVGGSQVLNITLRVGQATETVDVATTAPAVDLATSSLGAVVNSTTIRELPLNGRSWTDLASLQPGVAPVDTQFSFSTGTQRGNRGFGSEIAVAGTRPQSNNYRLDGISINDYMNGAPGSVTGGMLGVDAIQEFSVLMSNYSAEYGRTAGGVVNAITRSGTNQFHGSAFEFLRNSALDSRNFFDGTQIPPFRRNQFGAAAGGPIKKGKVFVFGAYEGIRQSLGITNVDTVPSPAVRSGNICSKPDTTPACVPTQLTVDPSAQKYLPFWPLPNAGIKKGTNGDIGIFTFAGQQVVHENFFTSRVDVMLSERDNLFATYLSDVTPFTTPDSLNNVQLGNETNRQIGALEETHIFSSALVNSARIGYSRVAAQNGFATAAINPLASDPSLAAMPGSVASLVSVPGLTPFPGGENAGSSFLWAWNSFQGYDDAFWTHGTHSLKFGGAVERMEPNLTSAVTPGGNFTFGTLSDFLTNHPQKFNSGFTNITNLGIRQSLLGLYVQDDWRVRSNLTLNVGLRWEMVTVPTEVHSRLANLINMTDAAPHLGNPYFSNPTLRNFEPRVGFSWDPFHNGKTAVRGGFGIFDVLPLPYQFFLLQNKAFPFFQNATAKNLPAGSFFSGAAALLGPKSKTADFVPQHPGRDYLMEWNFNVQRELAQNLTATVSYVGSHGVHQPLRVDDIDIVLPKKTSQGYVYPVGSGTLNPNFAQIYGMLYTGESLYDGLLAGIQQRMSHGVQLQGSFTWSRSIDTGSATAAGDQFTNGLSSLPWYDTKLLRGPSDFNIGRRLVINAIWQLPSLKSFSGPAAWITNGWELGAIYQVHDGLPFTATWGTNGDPQGLNSSDPFAFPNRLTGQGCSTLTSPGNSLNYIKTQCFAVPTAPDLAFWTANCDQTFGTPANLLCPNLRGNAGRNILIGPGLSNLDLSLFKNFPIKGISEKFELQFRAEVFNILNHVNFASPETTASTDIFDSSGALNGIAGLLTSTTTTSRQIQFGLKAMW